MFVCHCEAVSDRTVAAAVASGARTLEQITERCRAGGGCGGCHLTLLTMISDAVFRPEIASGPTA